MMAVTLPLLTAVCCIASSLVMPQQAQADTAVVELNYRTAEQLLPLLEPHRSDRVSVSGLDSRLVLSGAPADIAQMKAVIASLDTEPALLRVSLDRGQRDRRQHADTGVPGGVTITRRSDGSVSHSETVVIRRHSTASLSDTTQQVQTLEGSPAQFHLGDSEPVLRVGNDVLGRTWVEQDYRDRLRGFSVTPVLLGERVKLLVEVRWEQPEGAETRVETLTSTVTGRLGEWITLGGLDRRDDNREDELLRRQTTVSEQLRAYRIQVTRAR